MCKFIVGHCATDTEFDIEKIVLEVSELFEKMGTKIHRYNSARGKVVKFSQSDMNKRIASNSLNSVSLYSEYRGLPSEFDENENWKAYVAFSKSERDFALAYTLNDISLKSLFKHMNTFFPTTKLFDYIYGYEETQHYGLGYALDYYSEDDQHELLSPLSNMIENWETIRRQKLECNYLRDVFEINVFSKNRLRSLGPKKQAALAEAMKNFGHAQDFEEKIKWVLNTNEIVNARIMLLKDEVLAAYIR